MIVVDANVLAYRVIMGEKTALTRQVEQLDSAWAVPLLCKHELANVLWQQLRHDKISSEEVPAYWSDFEAVIGDNEHEVPMPAAVLLAHERGITTYDAQYVWLAQELNTKLVTEDAKLLASSPRESLSMKQYIEARDE